MDQVAETSPAFSPALSPKKSDVSIVIVDENADGTGKSKNSTNVSKCKYLYESPSPLWYQFLYCTMYLIMGSMYSAAVLVLPYFKQSANTGKS